MQYEVFGNGNTQTVNVSGGGALQTIISGLEPSRTFLIKVAAMNGAGVGLYSDYEVQLTLGKQTQAACISLIFHSLCSQLKLHL